LIPEIVTVFSLPAVKSAEKLAMPVSWPLAVGTKATVCATPFTSTVANRWVLSPFVYRIRIVVRVSTSLCTPLKVNVPAELPPRYPIAVLPEQPLQETVLAPPERVLVDASASYELSLGAADQVPEETRGIQL
jgi:hypothetical protein